MASSSCTGLSCQNVSEGPATDVPVATAAPDASPPAEAVVKLLKVVCGGGSCAPDDPRACRDYKPPASSSGGTLDAGSNDSEPDGGSDSLDAGIQDAARDLSVDGSFSRPTSPEAEPSEFSCQLSPAPLNTVTRSCMPAGTRTIDEACTSSADCEPGLGCVGSVRAGRCLPFCCATGGDTCEAGYYCARRPLRSTELGEANGPDVPVCDRAENCSLGEPADCTGEHCVCAPGTACAVVRPDGTTACEPEGQGVAGENCPCKWGYHCSQATSPPTCVKTCELNILDSCGSGVCQATPLLPEGWGTCVGGSVEPMP